ncbi:biotin/lipoyl-containing protein [Polymorphobacter fuscus]|uniref:Biotin attachment protein n=1 Tax=Sandarakinorhabdus fusca TaxID=1439888 RepID=A0A7C9GRQ0_9SPHN|nr:biotin/lipoyl-containing protein [Polymorphobacter fuscus]KAB7643707.1 biotin attachment protein [Polymorphobacter fuscus]MQT18650.1 biotin attachment protein [Polymorphobacter fuscus]NJC08134.1 pyruvate/2-oxoglutarate dehydrogenase complex dihydrolipoamide acyltransferase (E2) component [Polymorphobacter fuscus]
MIDVHLPFDLWEDDDITSMVVWLYPDGALVHEGDLVAEILVEKATLELFAPATGTLRIGIDAEPVADKGHRLATIH